MIERTAREGAQWVLQTALEAEVEEHLARYARIQDTQGWQEVVRNGHAPQRTILTGVGPVSVARLRVDERKAKGKKGHEPFSSAMLPRFLRRTPTLEGALATLYLNGISTNDFPVRLDEERSCVLVVIGGNFKGKKELLAVRDGYRESEQSWKELLVEIKDRGLEIDPKPAIADRALGFCKALPQLYPTIRAQRCWVHKTANILNKLPSSTQGRAKTMIHDIYRSESKESALKAYRLFRESFQDKYPEATSCLSKDEEALFTFYEYPAAHWQHIRSTNVIDSVFATVRLRTYKTKGCGTRVATLSMVFKLMQEAQRSWRKLDGSQHLSLVQEGRTFCDGVLQA